MFHTTQQLVFILKIPKEIGLFFWRLSKIMIPNEEIGLYTDTYDDVGQETSTLQGS